MVESYPVQKFKVEPVEPTIQNCDRTSIRHKCECGEDVTEDGWHKEEEEEEEEEKETLLVNDTTYKSEILSLRNSSFGLNC